MEFFSILTKISLYNYTVSIIGSVIGLRHDISDYNEERKGKEPQHENVRVTMKKALFNIFIVEWPLSILYLPPSHWYPFSICTIDFKVFFFFSSLSVCGLA